ncbi:MAG: PAS domain-containing protein [Candidatus Kerfeldbacteria bacterium]|nr:PAS domain-containing protein [Candidatus Kerfeldbacteria bacterium]
MDKKLAFVHAVLGIIRGRWIIIFGTTFLGIVQKFIAVSSVHLTLQSIGIMFLIASSLNVIYYLYFRKGVRRSDVGLRTMAFISIFVDQLLYTLIVYTSGGIESLSFVFYIIPILMATILYRPLGIMGVASINVLLYLSVIFLEFYEVLPHQARYAFDSGMFQNPLVTASNALLVVATIFLSGVFSTFISQLLNEREHELIVERDRTRSIIANLIDGLLVVDQHRQIMILNSQAEDMLAVPALEWVTRSIQDSELPQNLVQLRDMMNQARASYAPVTKEMVIQNARRYVVSVTVAHVVGIEGAIIGQMAVLRDITREKEIDRMKSEFISVASHQLRTPLSAIKWVVKMLLDGDAGELSPEQKNLLDKGYRSNERMITLVNDLLNVSRIEEGRFQYQFSFEPIVPLVESVVSELKPILSEKHLTVNVERPATDLPKVKIDANKLRLAIQNLLDNGIKYTPQGGTITVRVRSDRKYLTVEVQDTGVGIPKAQQAQMFQKFFRATNVVKLQTEGSGLGLFIVKNIVERHGGRISFESEEGKGSVFRFTLPLDERLLPKDESEFEKFMASF